MHPKLTRPALGHYARTEYALVGSTCARMEAIMQRWADQLADRHRCLLVTGDHGAPASPVSLRYDRKRFTPTDDHWNDFDDRLLGRQYDLALVNGNHYPAARQIVFVDEAKAGTLVRRKSQISQVTGIVHVSGPLPEWLPPAPTVPLAEVDRLLPSIEAELGKNRPPLRALILTGGKSQRMGRDKSQLIYQNGQTEVARLVELCAELGVPASLSVRTAAGERGELADRLERVPRIADRLLDLGPAGAICSAFLHQPDTAWLVLACDLPLLDRKTLRSLLDARRTDRVATAVRAPDKEWPEPLVAIYEPRAYPRLLQFLGLGYSCPRKLLINSDTEVIDLPDAAPVTNANTPEERAAVLARLNL